MDEPARICPRCHAEFGAEDAYCPDDGSRLLNVRSEDDGRVGSVIADQFTLIELLGRGGMGTVYRALQHSMDREVAVKLLKRSLSEDVLSVKRFLQEARSASKLNHPNIITLIDFGQTEDDELFMVMELLHGQSLGELMDNDEVFSLERAVSLISQVCDALEAAHEQDVVHRDVKPDNIFIVEGAGRLGEFVKMLDFGIAKVMAIEGAESLTTTGTIFGTPAYIAPEQATGEEVDGRADVYGCAVVLYEMLVGHLPFEADTPVRLILKHLQDKPPAMTETASGLLIPEAVQRVVLRALEKHPDERPQSAKQLKQELTDALSGHIVVPTPSAAPTEQDLPALPDESKRPPRPMIFDTGAAASTDALPKIPRSRAPWYLLLGVAVTVGAFLGLRALLGGGAGPATDVPPDGPVTGLPTADATATAGDAAEPRPAGIDVTAAASAETAPAEPEPDLAAPPEPPRSQRIRVESEPPGAVVLLEGARIGRTPTHFARPEAGTELALELRLRGYYKEKRQVAVDADDVLKLELRKRPTAGPVLVP